MAACNYKKYLYKLIFPNGRVYIGVTNNIKTRWAGGGAHYTIPEMHEAIKECGWDNVQKVILLHLHGSFSDDDIIRSMEKELIQAYGDRAYNLKCCSEWESEQAKIRRENGVYNPRSFWTIGGVTKPSRDWCAEYGKCLGNVYDRMRDYGLTLEEALTFPACTGNRRKRADMVQYFEKLRQERSV